MGTFWRWVGSIARRMLGPSRDASVRARPPSAVVRRVHVEVHGTTTVHHRFWFEGDRHHREDGPAIEYDDGSKEWYLNGERHRENGPAIEDEFTGMTRYYGWYNDGHPCPSPPNKSWRRL